MAVGGRDKRSSRPSTRPHPKAPLPVLCAVSFVVAFVAVRLLLRWSLWECALVASLAAYLPSYFDGSEHDPFNSRVSPAFARLGLWALLARYFFDGQVVYEASRDEYAAAAGAGGANGSAGKAQYALAVHPHGVGTLSHVLFFTDACGFLSSGPLSSLLHRRDLAAAVLFRIPLFRDFLLALGCVDASAATCHRLLQGGLSLQLYLGGEREQMLAGTQPQPTAVARDRRGFVRLALHYDLCVLPCYVFGEDRLYHCSSFLLPLRLALVKAARIALPLAWGRYWWCPIVPLQQKLLMVVGKPLRLDGGGEEAVSEERVQAALTRYCDELTALFDRHKGEVEGYETATLKVL